MTQLLSDQEIEWLLAALAEAPPLPAELLVCDDPPPRCLSQAQVDAVCAAIMDAGFQVAGAPVTDCSPGDKPASEEVATSRQCFLARDQQRPP